jgi:hypothetical protein
MGPGDLDKKINSGEKAQKAQKKGPRMDAKDARE